MERPLPYYRQCFVCGEVRLERLGVRFRIVDRMVRASFKPSEKHVGFPGIVHGGILAAVLDEAMAWAVFAAKKRFAVSAELTIRYLRPLPPQKEVEVVGYIVRQQRRIIEVASEIHDADAIIYARAWGRFLPVSLSENEQWLSTLEFPE